MGIHLDQDLDFVAGRFISVGWDDIGDLKEIGPDKESLKEQLASSRPNAKPGAFPVWAGVLLRFAFEMHRGDLVVYPRKSDRKINLGIIDCDYEWHASEPTHRHRRTVRWIQTGLPRAMFRQGALYEIGSAVTLFRVKNHTDEFVHAAHLDPAVVAAEEPSVIETTVVDETSAAEDLPSAGRILENTRDFILKTLATDFKGHAFAEFAARLLEAMGYRTQVSPPGPDRGIDILAHKDPLGLEPPIIKVQCKSTEGKIGSPEVSSLAGTLSRDERGLFVTLGYFSADARNLGKDRTNLRLIDGTQFVDLVLEYYDRLSSEDRSKLPLRLVHVQDAGPSGS